jgi:hypothetical protein
VVEAQAPASPGLSHCSLKTHELLVMNPLAFNILRTFDAE